MTLIFLSPRARADVARLTEFLTGKDPVAAAATADLIFDALYILKQHPHIGRPAVFGYRELVIRRGRSAHLALYRVDASEERAEILAIRHQRESGYGWEDL